MPVVASDPAVGPAVAVQAFALGRTETVLKGSTAITCRRLSDKDQMSGYLEEQPPVPSRSEAATVRRLVRPLAQSLRKLPIPNLGLD